MALVCPQCTGSFDNSLQCPQCGVPLLAPGTRQPGADPFPAAGRWQQTPWGRIGIGVGLALGLCYALLQLCQSILRAFGYANGTDALDPLARLALFEGLQALGLLGGGLVAGAGKRQGLTFGAVVGILTGALSVLAIISGVLKPFSSERAAIPMFLFYGLPVLHALVGALGGAIGAAIWKPMVEWTVPLVEPTPTGPALKDLKPALTVPAGSNYTIPFWFWKGPVDWPRVLVGATLASLGILFNREIASFITEEGQSKVFRFHSLLEEWFTQIQIISFSILLGGCIGGSTRRNGLKQGAFVGVLISFVLSAVYFTHTSKAFGLDFLLEEAGWSVLVPLLAALMLGPVGGYCGCELIPPILKFAPRRRSDWL